MSIGEPRKPPFDVACPTCESEPGEACMAERYGTLRICNPHPERSALSRKAASE